MFRSATVKEIECVLRGSGVTVLPPRPVETDKEVEERRYKKLLSEKVRETMLAAASKFIVAELHRAELRQEVMTATGLSFDCACLEQSKSCEMCQEICTNFAKGILAVLERDFMQLLHGDRASELVADRKGVQFLLTGVILALLYESVPEKLGLDELVLTVLIIMMNAERWTLALEFYGPAPKRALQYKEVQRSLTIGSNSRSLKQAASVARQMKKRREQGQAAVAGDDIDTTRCSECGELFPESDEAEMVEECDCGTVTILYNELLEDAAESEASDALSVSTMDLTSTQAHCRRPRSYTL